MKKNIFFVIKKSKNMSIYFSLLKNDRLMQINVLKKNYCNKNTQLLHILCKLKKLIVFTSQKNIIINF